MNPEFFLITAPVFKIDILVAGIPVGTNNELPALATQHSQVLKKRVHETVFACLSSVEEEPDGT